MNEQFEFKSAANGQISLDQAEGIVECFVAGIGNKDSVGDIVVTGAFAKSLTRRKPRVVWAHSWNDPIGKVLEMYEVPPGDPRLPAKMRNAGIGGLYAKVQFNLQSEKGKEAFASVAFFGEEQEWSIGYKTITGAFDPAQQANVLKEVELYEVSPVLHGANQLTGTISVKSEQKNHMMPVIAGMPMMGEQQQPRMIVIAAPEKEQEQDEPFNIFAEGLAQPLEVDKVQKIQAELSERTGSKVDIVEATDSFIVFRRTTTDGKVSMYRVGYHTPDGYNTFMFGKPEAYSGNDNKPQMQQEIEVKPADTSMVPMQPQQIPYRDDDQDEMNTMLGGQVGVGKSAYAHLIEIPQIHMVQAKSMLQPVFNYHNLSTTDSDNGIIVNGSISAQAIDALQTAVKAIGQTIGQSVGNLRTLAQSFNPFAIDGDNDGFAQDGTAFQRPYIPIKRPDTDLPEVGGKKRNSSELLDKPTIRTGKKPTKDPSLLQGQERQQALAAGELQPRTMDDISFLANRRPENEGLAKYWDMSEEGLRAEGQKLVAARRGQTGSAREATDGELFKISHEFSRREAYKNQFGKEFVPPKRTESTGRETFDYRDLEATDEMIRPAGREFTGYNPFIERDKEKQRFAKLAEESIAEYEKGRSKRGFASRGDVTPEQQNRIDASRKRGADIASGRAQILADNLKNLSDEDKDTIREEGIVSFLLQDGTGGPLSGEWAGDSPAERIGDLLPEGDWSTDSELQADAEDIFASYEEGFYGQLDKEFADLVNPADLETEKSRWDGLSANEQDSILEQGRDSARGLASRGETASEGQRPPRTAVAMQMDPKNSKLARQIDYDPQNGDLTVYYRDGKKETFNDVPYDRVRKSGADDKPDALISALQREQNKPQNRSGFASRNVNAEGSGLWGTNRPLDPDDEELSDEYIEQWLTDKVKFDTDITFDQLEKYNNRTGGKLSDSQLEDLHNRYLSDDKTISDEAGDEILSKFFKELEEDYYDDMVEDTIPEPDYEDYERSRGFASLSRIKPGRVRGIVDDGPIEEIDLDDEFVNDLVYDDESKELFVSVGGGWKKGEPKADGSITSTPIPLRTYILQDVSKEELNELGASRNLGESVNALEKIKTSRDVTNDDKFNFFQRGDKFEGVETRLQLEKLLLEEKYKAKKAKKVAEQARLDLSDDEFIADLLPRPSRTGRDSEGTERLESYYRSLMKMSPSELEKELEEARNTYYDAKLTLDMRDGRPMGFDEEAEGVSKKRARAEGVERIIVRKMQSGEGKADGFASRGDSATSGVTPKEQLRAFERYLDSEYGNSFMDYTQMSDEEVKNSVMRGYRYSRSEANEFVKKLRKNQDRYDKLWEDADNASAKTSSRLNVQGKNNALGKWWSSYGELTDDEQSDIEQAYFENNPGSERPGSRDYNPEVAQGDFEANPEKYGYAEDFRKQAILALRVNGADRDEAENVADYWIENDGIHEEYLEEADGDSLYAMALAYDNYIESAADDYNERQRGFGSRGDATPEMRPYSDLTSKEKSDLYESVENYLNNRGDWARVKNELEEGGFDYDDFLEQNPEFHPDFADFGDAGDMGFGSGYEPLGGSRRNDPAYAREYEGDEYERIFDEEMLEMISGEPLEDLIEFNDREKGPFSEEELTKLFEENNFEAILDGLRDQYIDRNYDNISDNAQWRYDERGFGSRGNAQDGELDIYGFGKPVKINKNDDWQMSRFDEIDRQSQQDFIAELEAEDYFADGDYDDADKLSLAADEWNGRGLETRERYTDEMLGELYELENIAETFTRTERNGTDFEGSAFAYVEETIKNPLSTDFSDYEEARKTMDSIRSSLQKRVLQREKNQDDANTLGEEDFDEAGFASRGGSGSRTVEDFENLGYKYGASFFEDTDLYERASELGKAKGELTTAIDEAENMLDGLDEDSPEWERLFNAQQEMSFKLGEIEDMMEEMVTEKDRLDDAMGLAATLTGEADDLVETRKGITRPSAEDLDELSFEDANYEYTSLMRDITYLVDENSLSVDWNEEKQSEIEKALRDGDYEKAEDMLYDVTQEIWDAADDKYRTAEAEYDDYPFLDEDNGFASRGGSRFDTIETPNSSAIEAVHYDRNTRELHVAFKPGQTGGEARYYTYSGVSPDYFDNEISGSNSIGRVINDVKKNYDVEVTNPRTVDAINGRGEVASTRESFSLTWKPSPSGDKQRSEGASGIKWEVGKEYGLNDTYYAVGYRETTGPDGKPKIERVFEFEELESLDAALSTARGQENYELRKAGRGSAMGGRSEIQDIDVRRSAALYESYYDPNAEELVVTFKDKDGNAAGSYIYEGVTADEANELASASSKGKVINRLKASKSVRRAGADDRMERTPGAADEVGSGGYEAQVDSHWDKIGPDEQRAYFARAVDSAINAGTGTSADEITADAKARAYDDRQIAMMEMQAEKLGMGYRKIDVGSSAALNRVEYDPDKRELRVEYRGRDGKGNGEFYVYQNVPQSVVDDIEASDSRGATLRRVRDDFEFRTESAIPESAFYSMGDSGDMGERSNPKITNRTNANGFYLDENGRATNYNKRSYTTADIQKINGRRNGRDGFASGRLGASPDDAEYGRELAAQRARDRAAGRNATNPIGNRESEAEGFASRGSINESSTGQRIVPSRMHSDDREALAEITDPEERKQRIDSLIEFYGPRIFAKPSKPKRKKIVLTQDENGYWVGPDGKPSDFEFDDGFASRGGTSKLSRDYPYSIDVEKPLEEENAIAGQLMRVNRYQNLDVPEYEPTPSAMPWKSLSPSQKERYGRDILRKNQEYFDRLRQNGASSEEIDYEIAQIHNEFAKGELISLERTLKMAKEDFYESARKRLEQANPSMSQNEIDDMLVDLGLSENDFDKLFAKNMDIFELAAVAADLESKRRDIVRISTPKTGGDRPKVDPLSILGGYSDGDVFGLTPRGFASRGESGVKKKTKEDVFADMQKQLIDALEDPANLGKWKLPWRRTGMPENGSTGKKYSGSNWFFLSVMSDIKGYDSNKWATYNQWQGLGGQVRKGEKGTQIFVPMFVKGKEKADGTMGEGRIMFKAATVFNLKQIDGMPADFDKKEILPEAERVSDLEKTISEIPAVIKNGGDRAFFQPSGDFIQVPNFENFNDARSYYSTVAHELMHWTGGKGRLDRGQMGAFGTPEYAYEELVAEIASAIFMSSHDIEPDIQENHGPYLASWLKALKQDPDALQRAMTDAQKAVNYVLDISPNAKSKFSHGEKAEFDTPEIAVVGEPVVAVEGFASRGDWPTPGGYEPGEFDMRTALSQIGRGNLMAISGTRAKKRNNEMVLPVNRNQQVIVGYDGGSDTYFVRAEQIITNGKDKGKTRVLGQWDNVYADELGETAYQASLKPSMLSDENKTVWAQAFDHPQTGSLLDENGQVYENGLASGGDSMDPDELDAMDWAYDAAQDYLMEQEDMMPEEPSQEDGFASRMNLSTPEKNEIISIARGMNTPFTRSVVAQYDRNGELSDRQWDALNRMTLRGNRRGFPSRGDEKRPRAPKAPWSPEDRQRFADGDRLRSKKRPGKRRNGPDASEYGFASQGELGVAIDMIESDIFFEGEQSGRSWGFEPIISRVAEKFGGKQNMSDAQLADALGINRAVAKKMRKPGARTSDIYLLDNLRIRVAGDDRTIWGAGNDPLAYYDESGKEILDFDRIPDVEDTAPDVPGTRGSRTIRKRKYIDPQAVLDEVGIDTDASIYSVARGNTPSAKENAKIFGIDTWRRILTEGITADEIDILLKAKKSKKSSTDIYSPEELSIVPEQRRTDSMPLADFFRNQAFDSFRGKRGFPQQVVEAVAEITGRRPSISAAKNFINSPRTVSGSSIRNPLTITPAQIRLLLDKLGISAEEFEKFRSE